MKPKHTNIVSKALRKAAQTNHVHKHNYLIHDKIISANQRKILTVVIITTLMMFLEIIAGHLTSSMALLADGWHMASHAGALGISYLAYRLAKSDKLNRLFAFGAGKFIPLGGYTNGIVLGIVASIMMFVSIERLLSSVNIKFTEALIVAVMGLIVNVVSAVILFDRSHRTHKENGPKRKFRHKHGHTHDHNVKSASVHILADGLTSIFAIIALTLGKFFNVFWLDALMGVIGAGIILIWAYYLCKDTLWELVDGKSKSHHADDICQYIEKTADVEVRDMHIWRIAPNAHACELVVVSHMHRMPDYYKKLICERFNIDHLIVEEHLV